MGILKIYRPYFAPYLMILGLFLLVAAQFLSGMLRSFDFATITLINIEAWGLMVLWFARYYRARGVVLSSMTRNFLVVAIFALSAFPFKSGTVDIGVETFSIAGMIAFVGGALLWDKIHPVFAWIGRIIQLHRHVPSELYIIAIYAVFLAITVGLSYYCFHYIPGYPDSIGQYIHGKIMAGGHLYGQTPTLPRFFNFPMMVSDGKIYAQYQPLHSAMLALGHLVGTPWLINPLEGALTVVLIYLLAQRIFGEATARMAGLLALVCPFMFFMSAEFMNHVTALLFTTLFVYAYVEMLEALPVDKRMAKRWAVVAGLSLGAVFLARPLDAVGVGLPFAIHAAMLLRKESGRYVNVFFIMAAGSVACIAFDLWYNQQVTGSALLFPSGKYHSGSNFAAMGFKGDATIAYVFSKAQDEWARLNKNLFEWWLPSTFFVMLFCLRPIKNRYAWLLIGMIVSHTVCNMANQFHSSVFGPRYMYQTVSALVILTAAGITRIPLLLETLRVNVPSPAALQGIIGSSILLIIAVGWTANIPRAVNGYRNFFDNHPVFYFSLLDQCQKPALVFLGRGDDPKAKYAGFAFTGPPSDDSPIIFAMDRGDKEDQELIRRYAYRHAYVEFKGQVLPFGTIADKNIPVSK